MKKTKRWSRALGSLSSWYPTWRIGWEWSKWCFWSYFSNSVLSPCYISFQGPEGQQGLPGVPGSNGLMVGKLQLEFLCGKICYKTSKISSSRPPAHPLELPTNISNRKALARDNPTPKPCWISEWLQKTLFLWKWLAYLESLKPLKHHLSNPCQTLQLFGTSSETKVQCFLKSKQTKNRFPGTTPISALTQPRCE